MSIQHMQMVFDAEGLTHSEKIVLLAYCNYTDAHGYVWAGVPRISDDTGASVSTIKRVRASLKEKNLLASKRRTDPRTGESISNLSRVNLPLLESMRRERKTYDDNVIEALTFEETPSPETHSDLRIGQSDPRADLQIGHFDPTPGVKMTSPKGQLKMTPNPSDEPSGSSSSGSAPSKEDEEESPSAKKNPHPRGVQPVDLIQTLTNATTDEAHALWENIRPDVKTSPGGLIRHMAANGDLTYRLEEIRRQRAPQPRAGASRRSGAGCTLHSQPSLPCRLCVQELRAEGEHARQILTDLLREVGPDARPDLVDLLKLETV